MASVPVGIALGSNLGDRHGEIEAGLAFLAGLSLEGRIVASSFIETVPVDCAPGTPLFLNAVAEIQVDPEKLAPVDLLQRLQGFEISRGRPARHEHHAPRPLDLDIIYYGDLVLREPGLEIPHPRALQRRFVLAPLAEIRPNLILPGQTKTVAELLQLVGADLRAALQ
jgi:2-amino-4-hydroxy-6-hydroxymethyldihydropteridine diphosphokinase